MRKLPVLSGTVVGAALLVAACGGGSTTPTVPPVNVPSLAIPSLAIPSIAIPSLAIPSFAIPTLPSGSFSLPSFAGFPSFETNADPTLAAEFPTQVSGQPVTNVETSRYMDLLNLLASDHPEQIQGFQAAMQGIGVDPNAVSLGTADTTANGDDIKITAIRTPGVDANQLLSVLPALAAASGGDTTPPIVSQANIGGKNAIVLTDADENLSYVYVHGDVAWSTNSDNAADVATVFAALP